MSDYWIGYDHGVVAGRRTSDIGPLGALILLMFLGAAAVAAAVVMAAVTTAVLIFCFVALYPLAALCTLAAACISALLLSVMINVLWHDPSPHFVLGIHSLYFNWIGVGFAAVIGIGVAWFALAKIEFYLRSRPTYYSLRHLWRFLFPCGSVAVALAKTQSATGITGLGIWLIVAAIATVLHFVCWKSKVAV